MNQLNHDCLGLVFRYLTTSECRRLRVNHYLHSSLHSTLAARKITRFIRHHTRNLEYDYQLGQDLLNNIYTSRPYCIIDITRKIHPYWTQAILTRIMQCSTKRIGVSKATLLTRLEIKEKENKRNGNMYGQAKLGLELCWLYVSYHNQKKIIS